MHRMGKRSLARFDPIEMRLKVSLKLSLPGSEKVLGE